MLKDKFFAIVSSGVFSLALFLVLAPAEAGPPDAATKADAAAQPIAARFPVPSDEAATPIGQDAAPAPIGAQDAVAPDYVQIRPTAPTGIIPPGVSRRVWKDRGSWIPAPPRRFPGADTTQPIGGFPFHQASYREVVAEDETSANDSEQASRRTNEPIATAASGQPSEAARIILDLMENLGLRTLRGTVFETPGETITLEKSQADHRETVTQYIRRLVEEDREKSRAARQADYDRHFEQAPLQQTTRDHDLARFQEGLSPLVAEPEMQTSEAIEHLQEVSHQLDCAAHQLEQQGLYPQADQIRHLAQVLRQDARRARAAALPRTFPDARPLANERRAREQEIQSLREEVDTLKRTLRIVNPDVFR